MANDESWFQPVSVLSGGKESEVVLFCSDLSLVSLSFSVNTAAVLVAATVFFPGTITEVGQFKVVSL